MSSSSVLVINSGSSSIKYQLVDPETGDAIAKGIVERIGDTTGRIKHEHGDAVTEEELPVPDHTVGMREVLRLFDTEGPSLAEANILAVGHRVVQGGRYFDGPALITDEVRNLIEELCPLAPLHNPAHLKGIDVARELMRNADDLKERTDIPDNVYEGIKGNKAKVLHLFIRRGVAQAKFSVQELREMEKLPGVQLIINEDDFDLDDDTIEEAGKDKLTRQMVEELFTIREMAEDMEDDGDTDFEGNPADRKYYVHFNSAPVEVLGEDGKVVGIRVEKTETSADGRMSRTGEFEEYPVQAVYHAIGYKPATAPGIAYDERRAHLANAHGDGRITTAAEAGEDVEVRERLYATGWAKRGPVGLIGSTKSDALLIVTNMLEDLSKAAEGGRVAADRDPESIDRLLAERGVKPIDFAGWKKVDAFERAEGAKEGREHKKVIEPEQMRALAHA